MSKKRFNLPNKFSHIILVIIILAAIVAVVYAATTTLISAPNPGHNSSQVFISVGSGKYVTLQNAIDSGYSIRANASPIATTLLPVSTPYHLASQILVTVVGGYTMTLQQAIDHGVLGGGATVNYATTIPAGGESASNININTVGGVTNLQSAVTSVSLSPCPSGQHLDSSNNCVSSYNVGAPCTPTSGPLSYTSKGTSGYAATGLTGYNGAVGVVPGLIYLHSMQCITAAIQTDGSCGITSYVPRGTACQDGYSGSTLMTTCDGAGNCIGLSDSKCMGCPFGTTGSTTQNGYVYCGPTSGSVTFSTYDSTFSIVETMSYQSAVYSSSLPGADLFSWSSSSPVCAYISACGIYGCNTADVAWYMKPQ